MPHPAWNKRLTPEVEGFIVEQYRGGLSAGEILKAIPFKTKKTVYDVLERHGVRRRAGMADYRQSFDEAAFAIVDTAEKAYWLGVLITDGYVVESGQTSPLVGLQMADREAAEGFRNFLGLQHPVLRIEPRGERHRPMYRAVCHSRRMAGDLARLGVSDNRVHENGTIRYVQWSHRSDVRRIARYLYKDGGPRLSRKYELLRECL
ncbi:MAG TPA: LAGLIDADG family homing endonuclease [Pyrinomonadaceae bacterium]|nr:LAGLIDADG family homing endonuclease [Pyrinomonadaceae bacterium]